MKPEVLIFPDIHGRQFWKDAINKFPKDQYPNLKIIFLGHYLIAADILLKKLIQIY